MFVVNRRKCSEYHTEMQCTIQYRRNGLRVGSYWTVIVSSVRNSSYDAEKVGHAALVEEANYKPFSQRNSLRNTCAVLVTDLSLLPREEVSESEFVS